MEGTNNLMKLLIKLIDPDTKTSKWVHLCYIPVQLYEAYRTNMPDSLLSLNKTLARWAEEDFQESLEIVTAEDLDKLKNFIKEFCKKTYPDIYLEQSTDRQGWLRVWISKKMREDLGINGE